jgi:hypothetical protein
MISCALEQHTHLDKFVLISCVINSQCILGFMSFGENKIMPIWAESIS